MLKNLGVIAALLWIAQFAAAQTTTNTVVLTSARDNTLYSASTTVPGVSGGNFDSIFCGLNTNLNISYRGLLYFDVAAAIPPHSRIESASLTLEVIGASGGAMNIQLNRLLADWGEAGSGAPGAGGPAGAPAQTGDATWFYRFYPNVFWNGVGALGHWLGFPSINFGVPSVPGSNTWASTSGNPAMVDDIQHWVDNPSMNFGWILRNHGGFQAARRFASREHPTASFRPKLTINYVARSGSNEDFRMSAEINGPLNGPLAFDPNMTATAGDLLMVHLESPMGGYDLFPYVLAGQLYNPGSPPFQSPFFPELYIDFSPGSFYPVIYLFTAFSNQFSTAVLPPGGQTFAFPIPPGLVGMSLMIQGYSSLGSVSTGNPHFTATDAFSVDFL